MSDQEWPQDINNWMEWPDDVDINSLLERADQLTQITPETLQEVFSEEVMPAEEVAGIARELATQSDDLFTKLAFLQSPLGLWEVWGESLGFSWHHDFLECMWDITRLVKEADLTTRQADDLLNRLIDTQGVLNLAIAPLAIIATKDVSAAPINEILQRFADAWERNDDGEWTYDFGKYPVEFNCVDEVAPLMAMCCLHPYADLELVERVMTICSETTEGTEFPVKYWEYIGACLADDQDVMYRDWACETWWRDGFFTNGLPPDVAAVGPEQLTLLAEGFLENADTWLAEYFDYETESKVAALIAARPELSDDILARFALVPSPDVAAAVIVNPASSETTKTAAQLNL